MIKYPHKEKGGNTDMKNLKDLGTLKLIALSAYVLSLIIFFLPINFQLNDTSNKLYNYFIAAGNSENNPMVTMILTALALIISIILLRDILPPLSLTA